MHLMGIEVTRELTSLMLTRKGGFFMYFLNQASRLIMLLIAILFILGIAGQVWAKSAYIGSEHHRREFDAWNINPDGTLAYQGTYAFHHASDPSGLAIDAVVNPGENPVIFCTSEFSRGVEVVDPISLTYMAISTGPNNLAGIDVDDVDNIVYVLRRQSNDLYIYDWDPATQTITQRSGFIDLPNMGYGFGLAFDDSRDILWVSDTGNNMVRAYDVSTWNEVAALSFSTSHAPVDVAVDFGDGRNIVYTVAGWYNSYNISKYDVTTGVETTHNTGARVIGCAVDNLTGYLYVTRMGPDDLQVWDTTSWSLLQDTADVGNPAGLCIPQEEVSYNPLNLVKDDGLAGGCVQPGTNLTYDICYDNLVNEYPVFSINITDNLPAEVDWVSGGSYDSGSHTVTWNIGDLPAGDPGGCVPLEVSMLPGTIPGTSTTNTATIISTETGPTTINLDTNVCEGGSPCCDLDNDNDCDVDDYVLFLYAYGKSAGDPGWIGKADYDADGIVALPDYYEWYYCYWATLSD